MKNIIISSFLFLVGCVPVPVNHEFPEKPEKASVPCENLKLIPENTEKLSVVLEVITTNNTLYHICKEKNASWNEWYEKQKKIFESVK